MKNFNDDSQEAIINSFVNNSIGRRKHVFNLVKLISNITGNQILAINGAWGSGKTYFIKQFELLVNILNNYDENGELINPELQTNNLACLKNLNDEQIYNINNVIKNSDYDYRANFMENPTNCLYFNEWEYNNNEEPILSLIYKIINDFPYLITSCKETKFKTITGLIDIVSNSLSKGGLKVSDYVDAQNLLDDIITSEEIKSIINEIFNELLKENSNKLVIVVDELDRCKPTYAIKLLEQIKHFINNENIIVILCTNMYQLSCTIKKQYGYGFSIEEYLDKIIDLTISLPQISMKEYFQSIPLESTRQSSNWFSEVLLHYINYRNLEMRSINRYVTMMQFFEKHIYLNMRKPSKERILFEYVFFPYCVGEQIFNTINYKNFITGKGFEEFYNYINSSEEIKEIVEHCTHHSTKKENRDIKKDMELIYNRIYTNLDINIGDQIRGVSISESDKKYFFELCTMLSDFTIE